MVWSVPGTNPGVSFTQVEDWGQINHEELNKVPLLLTPEVRRMFVDA